MPRMSLAHRTLAASAACLVLVGSAGSADAGAKSGVLRVVTAKKGTNVWVNGQKTPGGNLIKLYRGWLAKGDTFRVTHTGKTWCTGHANGGAKVDGFVRCSALGAVK